MKQRPGLSRVLEAAVFIAMALNTGTVIGQQPPATVIRPSATSTPASPRNTVQYGNAAKIAAGAITGYVYWDASGVQNNPIASCQGLTANVGTLSKTGMQILSSTSNFAALGPLSDLSAPGATKYMLCSYSFHNLPEHVYLRVQVSAPAAQFSAAVGNPSPFQIPGGTCNTGPQSTLSFILTGGEILCGDNAYNINFKLTPSTDARLLRAPAATTLLQNEPGNSGGLLSNAYGTPAKSTQGTTIAAQVTQPDASISNLKSGSTSGTRGLLGLNAGESQTSPLLPPTIAGTNVPKMPPMNSNAKRDASPPADAAAKAQIKSKLAVQLTAAKQRNVHSASINPPTRGEVPEMGVLHQQKLFVDSLRTQSARIQETLAPNQAGNVVMQNQPGTSLLLHAPPPTEVCPAPKILAVNGKISGVVFTQDPVYNDYIITGCGFGNQGGQVYLSGAVTGGRINLVVKPNQWNDKQIEVVVEPGLSGVLDGWPDLVVAPAGIAPAKFPNCRFYAQRQSVLLPTIPQQYANLANVPVGDSTHGFGTMYCPGPDVSHLFPCVAYNAGPPLDGITNGHDHRGDPNQLVSNAVDRDGGQLQFNAGEDVYDLSSMAPGFEIDYPIVFWYAWTSDVCEGWASDAFPKKPGDSVGYDTEGHYGWYKKTNTKIVVDWGVDHCAWRWLGMFKVDDWYNSGYSLQVYVKGPIGVDPWTGHPLSRSTNFGQPVPIKLVRVP